MLRLSRTGIRNLAASDVVYARGLQYYKTNRVVNAAWSKTNRQYKMTVKGNYNYTVTIDAQEDGSFEYSCNCPSYFKEKGACKHVVAALLFLLKYQEKSVMAVPDSPDEKRVYQLLEYFSNQEESLLPAAGEIFHLQAVITIPALLKGEKGRAYLSLRAGSSRFYKVQTLHRFLSDYQSRENIILGKEFRFIAGESEFDKDSEQLINFLLEICEIQDMIDKAGYTRLFNKSQIVLTKGMLLKLLELLGENSFILELYGKTYENVRFQKGNPQIPYDLEAEGDEIRIDYQDKEEEVIPLTDGGELLLNRGVVYQPDKRFSRSYVPFFNNLGRDKKPLIFRGENKQRFLEEVLPRITDVLQFEVPEVLKSRYITHELESSLYLDRYKMSVKAELRFRYGEYEFNCFEEPKSDSYIIVRNRGKEDEIMHLLEQLNFEPHSGFFLLKSEDDIYRFLTEGIEQLSKVLTLYYSEDFKRINVRQSGRFSVGLRVNSNIDLLEMELDYEGIPRDELRELFRSFQLKKKYYRLKDGSFLNLTGDSIQEMAGILEDLNLDPKDLQGKSIQLGRSAALYLEGALSEEHMEIEKNEEFKKLIQAVRNPGDGEYSLPEGIHATLRPYQITGYKWLRTLSDNSLGGILADDMGLGKTLQSIVYIAACQKENPAALFLIVCPSSLVYNWMDEFDNFAPGLNAKVVNGPPNERQAIVESMVGGGVLITSYPLIRRDIACYSELYFHTVFLDEAQFIKNASSQNAQSVKQLNAEHRFALTGTPIENSLSELWSIFDFIMPYYLLSHSRFVSRYEKQILKEDKETLDNLNRRIHPFILRRMKRDVLKELPEKYENRMLTDLTEEQKKVYLSYMQDIRSSLYAEIEKNGIERSQMKILAALTRLRQICCHPATFLDNYTGGSGKLELLLGLLEDALANGHRVLVFSQFTSMLKIIREELSEREISYFCLEGETPMVVRNDYVHRFNEGEGNVFLISLKAGGTGLNLTGADTVIHYDPWWNPAVEEQATDRAYRIGQRNPVHVIKLLSKGTIEEKIYKLQQKKKDLSDSVIQAKEVFITRLTREELEDIFQ
ncbi:MAG: DEAD/DEAH box helicase [Lachnospiraceae bacterium]|nr:DEAD/DEAH box helicase [Lachnospiraceae bacterium]